MAQLKNTFLNFNDGFLFLIREPEIIHAEAKDYIIEQMNTKTGRANEYENWTTQNFEMIWISQKIKTDLTEISNLTEVMSEKRRKIM